jgi:hypothetical protein
VRKIIGTLAAMLAIVVIMSPSATAASAQCNSVASSLFLYATDSN